MKKGFIYSFVLIGVLFLQANCVSDKENNESIPYAYAIDIKSPDVVPKKLDETLKLRVRFESETGKTVHNIQVRIYNKASNTEVYKKPSLTHIHASNGFYDFGDDIVLSLNNGFSTNSDWVVEAKVWGFNDDSEVISTTSEFSILP